MAKGSRLKDKVIIITGGANGIGKAYAFGMADEGAKLAIADINLAAAEATVKELKAKGAEAIAIKTDISNVEDTEAMAKKTAERFGRIDVLVHNAAMLERNAIARVPFWEISLNEWDKVIDVNLKGTFLCCRAVFPYMKAQNKGKIITTASGVVFTGSKNQAHYNASKCGVVGLTRCLARELGQFNINVNSIAPGATQSWEPGDAAYARRQQSLENILSSRALGRVQQTTDLVGAAIFFASADSDFITGQCLVVDGGEVVH